MKNSAFLAGSATLLAVLGWGLAEAQAPRTTQARSGLSKADPKNMTLSPELVAARNQARLTEYLTYRGTSIEIKPDTPVASRDLHASIAKAFSTANLLPQARLAHFAWLDHSILPDLRCNGWGGVIHEVKPARRGLFVTVSVSPVLALPHGGPVSTPGSFLETYEYANGQWRFLSGKASAGSIPGGFVLN